MLKAYYEMCKPRVVALMLITSVIGMYLASPTMVNISLVITANIGIGLSACAAAVLNQLIEINTDKKMKRTKNRPLANGTIKPLHAFIFAMIMGVSGLALLYFLINTLAVILTALTIFGYAIFYTAYLKRATPQNIVIGGAAGAAPPLLGWSAVTGTIHPHALLLMLIIYVWTPPHFWALAIAKQDEYAKTDLPMLPITHGIEFTKLSIVLYTILTFIASILPYITGMSGWIYLTGAIILGLLFLIDTIKLYYHPEKKYGMQTFKHSIIYLFAIFVLLIIDHYTI